MNFEIPRSFFELICGKYQTLKNLKYKGNTLFTNKDYENAPYWDLEFPTTIECSIFIQLPPETIKLAGGNPGKSETASESDSVTTDARGNDEAVAEVCAVVVIGYKQ